MREIYEDFEDRLSNFRIYSEITGDMRGLDHLDGMIVHVPDHGHDHLGDHVVDRFVDPVDHIVSLDLDLDLDRGQAGSHFVHHILEEIVDPDDLWRLFQVVVQDHELDDLAEHLDLDVDPYAPGVFHVDLICLAIVFEELAKA